MGGRRRTDLAVVDGGTRALVEVEVGLKVCVAHIGAGVHPGRDLSLSARRVPHLHFVDPTIEEMGSIADVTHTEWKIEGRRTRGDGLCRHSRAVVVQGYRGAVSNQSDVKPISGPWRHPGVDNGLGGTSGKGDELDGPTSNPDFVITVSSDDRASRSRAGACGVGARPGLCGVTRELSEGRGVGGREMLSGAVEVDREVDFLHFVTKYHHTRSAVTCRRVAHDIVIATASAATAGVGKSVGSIRDVAGTAGATTTESTRTGHTTDVGASTTTTGEIRLATRHHTHTQHRGNGGRDDGRCLSGSAVTRLVVVAGIAGLAGGQRASASTATPTRCGSPTDTGRAGRAGEPLSARARAAAESTSGATAGSAGSTVRIGRTESTTSGRHRGETGSGDLRVRTGHSRTLDGPRRAITTRSHGDRHRRHT